MNALAGVQTRSGTLVYITVCLFALLMPLRIRHLGRGKVLVIPILMVLGALLALPIIIERGGILWARFTDQSYSTGEGRLNSFLYLFNRLADPIAWILPQGNKEYLQMTGNVPHSTITAAFVEGGVFGLICWFMLMLIPVLQLLARLNRGKLDTTACLALLMCTGMLEMQLTLNAPFVDQFWLWGGAAAGTLTRLRYKDAQITRVRMAAAIGNTQA
jgi:O-antigen ligase